MQAPVLEQTGVFRVNCMDCLDRTNVVQVCVRRFASRKFDGFSQSCLAREQTLEMLKCMGLIDKLAVGTGASSALPSRIAGVPQPRDYFPAAEHVDAERRHD